MPDSTEQTGYNFSEQDLATIRSHLARIQASTGMTLDVTLGSANGFAGLLVSINSPRLNLNAKVLQLQSWREPGMAAVFSVMSEPDGAPFGPSAFYDSLVEALVYADIHLRRTVESLLKPMANSTSAVTENAEASKDIVTKSAVLSPEEIHYTQAYANELGHSCGLSGYADFVEAKTGVMSIAIGVIRKETKMILGTVVVVSNMPDSSCSVRDFLNKPMPGPEYYSSIYAALVSTRPYFNKLAQLAAERDASDGTTPKKPTNFATRIASVVGIVGMFAVFGVICSLLGFAAYFASRSKIGTSKAVGLTVAVALASRVLVEMTVK